MNRLAILLIVILFAQFSYGQQDAQFTQNMFNRLQVNPAFAGSNEAICGTLLSRRQWEGFSGAPISVTLGVHSNFNYERLYQKNAGAGISFMYDALGNFKEVGVKGVYAYRHAFNFAPGYFSLGVDAGIINVTVADHWVSNEPYQIDPAIPARVSNTIFDLGLGLYYYNGDKYYAGISAQHVLQPTVRAINPDDNQNVGNAYDFRYPRYRTFYAMGGMDIWYFNTVTPMTLRGSFLAKTDVTALQYDININMLINNFFWVGPSYRGDNTISVLLGMDAGAFSPIFEGFKAGLAYDIAAISKFNKYNAGSIELMVNYCYKITPPVKIRKYHTVKWL